MTGDFNIRDSNQDPSYPYHSAYTDTLHKIADSFNLELYISTNSVTDLMFLHTKTEEFNNYQIMTEL